MTVSSESLVHPYVAEIDPPGDGLRPDPGEVETILHVTLAELMSDEVYREEMRQAMNEPWRTLIGHLRHESGHYYSEEVVDDQNRGEARALFEAVPDGQDYRLLGVGVSDLVDADAADRVGDLLDPDAARRAQQEFIARFQKGKLPSEIPETRISAGQGGALIGEVLTAAGLSASNSEAFRMIKPLPASAMD